MSPRIASEFFADARTLSKSPTSSLMTCSVPFAVLFRSRSAVAFFWGTDARDEEIGRRRKELPHDLEADAAVCSKEHISRDGQTKSV